MFQDQPPYVDRDLGDFIPVVVEHCVSRRGKAVKLRLCGVDVWTPLSCLVGVDLDFRRPAIVFLPRWLLEKVHLVLPRQRWSELHRDLACPHPGDWEALHENTAELLAHVHYLYRAFIDLNRLAGELLAENKKLRKESGHDA